MINNLYNIYNLLSISSKRHTFYFLFVSLIYSFTEIITLGALLPLLVVVLNPEKFIGYIQHYGIRGFDVNELQFFVIFFFLLAVISSFICKLYLIKLNAAYTARIGSEINRLSFDNFIYEPYVVKKFLNSSLTTSFFVNKVNEAIGQGWMSILAIFNNSITLILILCSLLIYSPIYTSIFFLSIAILYLSILTLTKNFIKNRK